MASFQINLGPWGFRRPGLCLKSFVEQFCVCFFSVPIYLSCVGECCRGFPVELQECFLDDQTSHRQSRWEDNDWIFIFGWTLPLTLGRNDYLLIRHYHDTVVFVFAFWTRAIGKKLSPSLFKTLYHETHSKKQCTSLFSCGGIKTFEGQGQKKGGRGEAPAVCHGAVIESCDI